jgi:hypothetical protein
MGLVNVSAHPASSELMKALSVSFGSLQNPLHFLTHFINTFSDTHSLKKYKKDLKGCSGFRCSDHRVLLSIHNDLS